MASDTPIGQGSIGLSYAPSDSRTRVMLRFALSLVVIGFASGIVLADEPKGPADLIIHHAKVVTVDAKFTVAEAVAVKDGRIVAVGDDDVILKLRGPDTRVIDAQQQTVMPGLYDSHTHPVGAATSELADPLPVLRSLKDVFEYIKKKAAATPEGDWIVVRYEIGRAH